MRKWDVNLDFNKKIMSHEHRIMHLMGWDGVIYRRGNRTKFQLVYRATQAGIRTSRNGEIILCNVNGADWQYTSDKHKLVLQLENELVVFKKIRDKLPGYKELCYTEQELVELYKF